MYKRGISRFFVENLLRHSTEKLCRGNLLFFRKFLLSQNFMDQKGEGVGSECHNFPSKMCCLTPPKHFVAEPFFVSENSWDRKLLWIKGVKGGGVTIRNRNIIWHNRDSNSGCITSELCCPNPTAVFYF